jgi:hypothetical protein
VNRIAGLEYACRLAGALVQQVVWAPDMEVADLLKEGDVSQPFAKKNKKKNLQFTI